ncbi:MAG: hypothetical protein HQ512_10865 [Rhodospirillales bacterium]|nr:hypothetical protein [Rhodospirillales bacterium]
MSGLSHYIEKEGIPTTGISLVREHTVGFRPPRFLWVPFELGRPLGAPNNPEFQTRVLRAALALLESDKGPVLIEDFPDDAPVSDDGDDGEGWACPVNLPPPPEDRTDLEAAVIAEIGRLAPWYDLALSTRGRTTVGVSGLDIEAAAKLLVGFVEGSREHPHPELSLAEALKAACEDIKAWYAEAATARPGKATSMDVQNWFWGETVAGKVLIDVFAAGATVDDEHMKLFVAGFSMPRSQKHRLGK